MAWGKCETNFYFIFDVLRLPNKNMQMVQLLQLPSPGPRWNILLNSVLDNHTIVNYNIYSINVEM